MSKKRARKPWTLNNPPSRKKRRREEGKPLTVTPTSFDAMDLINENKEPIMEDQDGRIYGWNSTEHYMYDLVMESSERGDMLHFMWVYLPGRTKGNNPKYKRTTPLVDSFRTIDLGDELLMPQVDDMLTLRDFKTEGPVGVFRVVNFPEKYTRKSAVTSVVLELSHQ